MKYEIHVYMPNDAWEKRVKFECDSDTVAILIHNSIVTHTGDDIIYSNLVSVEPDDNDEGDNDGYIRFEIPTRKNS